jgi:hypothetical protein
LCRFEIVALFALFWHVIQFVLIFLVWFNFVLIGGLESCIVWLSKLYLLYCMLYMYWLCVYVCCLIYIYDWHMTYSTAVKAENGSVKCTYIHACVCVCNVFMYVSMYEYICVCMYVCMSQHIHMNKWIRYWLWRWNDR